MNTCGESELPGPFIAIRGSIGKNIIFVIDTQKKVAKKVYVSCTPRVPPCSDKRIEIAGKFCN